MKQFFEFLSQYWSQIFIFIMAIGYILKILIDWNVKKTEIKFSTLTIERNETIKKFYKDFLYIQLKLQDYLIFTKSIEKEKASKTADELNIAWEIFFDSFSFLKLFLNQKYEPVLDQMYKELYNLHAEIDIFYRDVFSNKMTESEIKSKYDFISIEIIAKKISVSLRNAQNIIRENFGVKHLN